MVVWQYLLTVPLLAHPSGWLLSVDVDISLLERRNYLTGHRSKFGRLHIFQQHILQPN